MSDKNKIIISELYPHVEKCLPKHTTEYMKRIAKYIDSNNEVLFDIGPGKRLLFPQSEKDYLFHISGLTDKDVQNTIKKVDCIDEGWNILGNSYNILNILPVRYYLLQKKKKEMETALIFVTLAHYSSSQFKYFRHETNDAIMQYTVNHLSNRFYLKQYGNIFKALYVTALNSHEKYAKELESGTDEGIKTYIASLRNRIDNLVSNVAKEFYENWEKGNYFNTESDDYSEENFHVSDNTSYAIKRIADAATMQTISRGVDDKFAKMAAKMTGVSVNAVRTSLHDIVRHKDQEINLLFTLILQLYLMGGKHTVTQVSSIDFITFCNDVYIKTNTSDTAILKIKEILDEWLQESSAQYRKTERAATLANYRKAIYFYCVFLLNNTSKNL